VDKLAIGVDLGGTKIATALVQENGTVLRADKINTNPEDGLEEVLKRIVEQVNKLIGITDRPVAGIGIGSPGFIKYASGMVRHAVNLDWYDVPLTAEIKKRLGCEMPVHLLVDTNASALGELYFGAGKAYKDFIYVSIGTGLGAGVVVNRQLVLGKNGLVGFIGHYALDPMGALCSCGLRDCPEMIVSGPGLVNMVTGKLEAGAQSSFFAYHESIDSHRIIYALQQNDPVAVVVFDQMVDVLADVLASGITWLNPEALIIGGGIGLASLNVLSPLLTQKLKQRLHTYQMEDLEIVPSLLTSSAVGAACLVFHST
jgi:glucokinase